MKLRHTTFAAVAICVATGFSASLTLQYGKDGYKGTEDTQICSPDMVAAHEEFGSAQHNVDYDKIHLHRC